MGTVQTCIHEAEGMVPRGMVPLQRERETRQLDCASSRRTGKEVYAGSPQIICIID